jgi:glutathione synthase/RimK-type ligase-like ATP-grasp enzyme
MIVIVGTASEDPVRRVIDQATTAGIDTVVLDEAEASLWSLDARSDETGTRIHAHTAAGDVELSAATGVYLRLTSPRHHGRIRDPLEQQRGDAAISLISAWADVADLRVANRPSAMASNSSKPFQAAAIRSLGFSVPETLVSNDPAAVRAFWNAHGRVIYKSVSGVRSIVHELTPARASVLDRVRYLPTQFQELLEGTNVRVHVIGDAVFPVEIAADTIDYRYREGGEGASMTPVALPDDIRDRCLALSSALDLPLAGVDLFRDREENWWCFEVNPSPAYSCFEEPTGLPMAAALVRWLAGEEE